MSLHALKLWPGSHLTLEMVQGEHGTSVRALVDPCGPEVEIPLGVWRRLLALTPNELLALRVWSGKELRDPCPEGFLYVVPEPEAPAEG